MTDKQYFKVVEIKLFDYVVLEKLSELYNQGKRSIDWKTFITLYKFGSSVSVVGTIRKLNRLGIIKAKIIYGNNKKGSRIIKSIELQEIREYYVVSILTRRVILFVENGLAKG